MSWHCRKKCSTGRRSRSRILINAAETGGGWLMFARIAVIPGAQCGRERQIAPVSIAAAVPSPLPKSSPPSLLPDDRSLTIQLISRTATNITENTRHGFCCTGQDWRPPGHQRRAK